MKKKLLFSTAFLLAGNLFSQTTLPSTLGCTTTLKKAESPYIANSTITLNTGCKLIVEAGVEIKMAYKADLIINGTASFLGTQQSPIKIYPKDTAWGNIFFNHGSGDLNYVTIESARPRHLIKSVSNPIDTGLQRAALSAYYSNIAIKNCVFKNNLKTVYAKYGSMYIDRSDFGSTNKQEKINLVFTHGAIVENSTFSKTYGIEMFDMIDFEGVDNGFIRNNYLEGGGDDGIDIGQSEGKGCNKITVSGNYIENIQDNGISIGEGSWNILISDNIIANSGYGIAVKDYSHALIDHNILYRDSVGLGCYKKNLSGGGNATVTNTIIANSIKKAYESEQGATLVISYSLCDSEVLPGINNINSNPAILSTGYKNFKISTSSPCINKGDPAFAKDPDGTFTDIGTLKAVAIVNQVEQVKTDDKFIVFPNPSAGILHIKMGSEIELITISDITGKLIKQFDLKGINNQANIDTQSIGSGIYILRVRSNNFTTQKRIVLE